MRTINESVEITFESSETGTKQEDTNSWCLNYTAKPAVPEQ